MSDKDRIRLAEWMGLKDSFGLPVDRNSAFDPFTDANDDYAVLEWMRNGNAERWDKFVDALNEQQKNMPWESASYILGDYARAALKVLDK